MGKVEKDVWKHWHFKSQNMFENCLNNKKQVLWLIPRAFFLFPSGARWLQAFLSIREALQNAVFFRFAASFALFEMKTTKHPTLGRLEGLFDWYATYEELNDARWYENARVCFSDIFSPNSFIYKGFLLQGLGSMLA